MISLTEDIWNSIIENDSKLDGKIWYAVKSTKIFCKPSCHSKIPNRDNVVIYNDPNKAIKDGFRTCKRCRPLNAIVSNNTLVKEIDYILQNNYSEKLTLKELAFQIHVSESYLRHIYKENTGLTPQQKLTNIRVKHAKDLLIHTNNSISNIGNMIGIPNTAYFIKLFKRYYGRSPYRYRININHIS